MDQGQEGLLYLLDAQRGCTEKWPFTRRYGEDRVYGRKFSLGIQYLEDQTPFSRIF